MRADESRLYRLVNDPSWVAYGPAVALDAALDGHEESCSTQPSRVCCSLPPTEMDFTLGLLLGAVVTVWTVVIVMLLVRILEVNSTLARIEVEHGSELDKHDELLKAQSKLLMTLTDETTARLEKSPTQGR